jgi:hypothetical protein
MPQITITEALQEIKTIGKRLEKKRQSISQYLARDTRVRDPLEKDGGSAKFITEERQAIADLEKRVIAIRIEIQRSNLAASLTVGTTARTVAEWLTWRREISAAQSTFLNGLVSGLSRLRDDCRAGRIRANLGRLGWQAIAVQCHNRNRCVESCLGQRSEKTLRLRCRHSSDGRVIAS